MAKFTHIANSFKAGQLGEKLVGRTDIEEYRNGCLEMKNMISTPTGGAIRRGGVSRFSAPFPEQDFEDESCVLVPFILSESEAYTLILYKDFAPRIIDQDGTILSPTVVPLASGAFFPDDMSKIRWAQFGRFIFFCSSDGNVPPFYIFRQYGFGAGFYVHDFSLDSTTSFEPLMEPSTPAGFRMPYQANLDSSLNLQYIRGTDPAPDKIKIELPGSLDYFSENYVGSFFRFRISAVEYLVRVTDFVDGDSVEVEWDSPQGTGVRPPASTTSDGDWSVSEWGEQNGWPQCVTVFQNRLIFGATFSNPTTIWASAVGNPFIFMQEKLFQDQETETTGFGYSGALDDLQAFDFPISSTRSTEVTWLGSQRSLHVGTDTVEYALASDTGLFGALSLPNLRPQTFHGSRNIQPERIGRYSIFIGEDGRTVRDFAYSDQNGSHASRDLSILSPDIIFDNLRGGTFEGTSYKQLAWQESNRTLWALTNRGSLVSFSFDENSDLKAWATHQIGGDPEILSCCVTPFKGKSTLFLGVKRKVGEVEKIYVLRLVDPTQDPKYFGGSSEINYFDLGEAYVYEEATDTHDADGLEGEEVFALADGNKVGPFTVTDGTFTTATEVTEISFGKKYQHKLTTMPLEAGTVIGSAQGQLKRVDRMFLDLYRAEGTKLSYGDTSYPIEYPSRPSFTSFTGRVKYDYDSTPDERYLITLEGDDPLPFGILNITFRGVTQD